MSTTAVRGRSAMRRSLSSTPLIPGMTMSLTTASRLAASVFQCSSAAVAYGASTIRAVVREDGLQRRVALERLVHRGCASVARPLRADLGDLDRGMTAAHLVEPARPVDAVVGCEEPLEVCELAGVLEAVDEVCGHELGAPDVVGPNRAGGFRAANAHVCDHERDPGRAGLPNSRQHDPRLHRLDDQCVDALRDE